MHWQKGIIQQPRRRKTLGTRLIIQLSNVKDIVLQIKCWSAPALVWDQAPQLDWKLASGGMGEEGGGGACRHAFYAADPPWSPSNCQQVDVTDVSSHECTWKSTTRRTWVFKQISKICQHWAFCPMRSWYQVLLWCIGGMKRVSPDSATPFLPHFPARQFPAQLRGCGPRLPQPKSKGRGPGNDYKTFKRLSL